MRVVRSVDVSETDFFGLVSPEDNNVVSHLMHRTYGRRTCTRLASFLSSYSTEMD